MNEVLFAVCPLTVTENSPDDAPDGTTATMLVADQLVAVAFVPFSEIVLFPWLAPKFVPVIRTDDPTGPELGEMLAIVGA
jgi:hypothetical protein